MAAIVVAIGFTDVTFAMDSISSVLAITGDAVLIITSQTLSILLLRCNSDRVAIMLGLVEVCTCLKLAA